MTSLSLMTPKLASQKKNKSNHKRQGVKSALGSCDVPVNYKTCQVILDVVCGNECCTKGTGYLGIFWYAY